MLSLLDLSKRGLLRLLNFYKPSLMTYHLSCLVVDLTSPAGVSVIDVS